mmetsp:Transcript_31513/g.31997  ORF Transcript_31513/g.31997 Transcript_31513/m.31997 type:complete len:116 (-) Transcript_31513:11-358(-)
MESEGWSHIEESPRLLVELLRFVGKVKNQNDVRAVVVDEDDVTHLDVTSLRERLLEAKLDIDGNQEILMERLKDHISSRDSTRNENASSQPAGGGAAADVAAPQRQLRPRRQPRR